MEIQVLKNKYSNVGAVNVFVGYVRDLNNNRDVKYLDFFRIKNYKDLKSKIEEKHNEISIDKKDYYCLESS